MKKNTNFTLVLILIMQVYFVNIVFSQTLPKDDPLYELVFVDEFDSISLKLNKWETHWPWSLANMKNNNYAYKTDNSGNITDSMDVALLRHTPFNQGNWEFDTTGTGKVRMIYKKEDCSGYIRTDWSDSSLEDSLVNFKFSGAMMRSKELFKYGYFEYKFKIDNPTHDLPYDSISNAYGPNFWLWNHDTLDHNPGGITRPSADYSELDILELDGKFWEGDANIHYQKTEVDTFFRAKSAPKLNGVVVGDKPYEPLKTHHLYPHLWHTVSCEWTKEYTDFYYDAPNFHRRYSDSLIKIDELIEMPITIDNYMPAFQFWIHFDTLLTKQPIYYDIDYIKVYQAKQEYIDKVCLNTNSNSFESKVYKSLVVGGSGGSALFNTGKQHLCAEEYVLLNENTEISGTAEVTISCRPYQPDQWHGIDPNKANKTYNQDIIDKLINTKLLINENN